MGFSRSHENKLITFEDHSGDFISGSSRKRPRSIPLPNPHYLAIHAAIAGILHMSGAGKFFNELLKEYKYKKGNEKATVNLHAVMSAMLTCVEECGGESGKRYVASAIISCGRKGDDNTIELLAALGTTWLTHLLFIYKFQRLVSERAETTKRSSMKNLPSRLATPTLNCTTSEDRERSRNRRRAFKKYIMVRDGYTYVIIGRQDLSHPSPDPTSDFYPVSLEVCHNLPRVISSFDNDRKSDSTCISLIRDRFLCIQFTSAVTSFDILANFTGLPVTVLDELHGTLDDPSNGLLLAGDAHKAFDQFYWCLKPTEVRFMVFDLLPGSS
ncbi:uncharacterized protein LACBIDRAFT_328943 [Laccaria bicolor S238N-H82]|uniref:Predicted protein n=1 Tax=Laccaria bicolor (strain S238N-H82 / ATCC MYA-4686) TaxID=486041 RepID=B0DGI4_LACBS|nr:uncharacterized protein LACBIDRAFT_328943 [Laccaria bicolor S238N-H82]EDR06274.1 predicted protein [Laccaria bicolor S238N-H82]|eukprot:XP_001883135.1 predicted protein [Laccaria bicolor S238N-H82]